MAKKQNFKIDRKTKSDLYDKFSSYFLDLSKLVFAGVILAGIMGMEVNTTLLFLTGGLSVGILSLVGYIFIILKHNVRA